MSEHSTDVSNVLDKQRVAAIMDSLSQLMELDGSNPFEVRAYQNASRAIAGLEGDLADLVAQGKLAGVPGLGKTIIARVTELVTTGTLRQYEDLLERVPPGMREMLRIPGLGPKRIRQINQALGIDTLEGLRAAAETDAIATLPGFGAKSQENILKGLAFVAEHQNRFRLDIAESQAEQIATMLRALPQAVRVAVGGSIRRRKETVKDVDVVASVRQDTDRAALMEALTSSPLVASVTGSGETKTSVVLHQGIALDLRVVLDSDYPYTLHHFTGSKEHNVALRTRLHAKGMKISEYGLYKGDTLIPCADEADIYRALGMAYVEPELREDRGEIEAALAGDLPTLLTLADIRGMLHVHSDWSDGGATIHEMVEATLAMGMSYLGMCDHSQVAAYANGLTPDRVKRQHDEIDRLNLEYAGRLRILKGTECDILKDGALDYDDATLATFDFVVASIHSNFNLPPAEQTQRLIRAIENPYCSILGHPTGRILLQRDGYAPDMEEVAARAGELGVAIELNGDPHRLDIDWRYIRFATERGVRIPITTDAHSPAGLGNIRYGVGLARKGWLTSGQCLNALSAEDILAFFAEQRARRGA
ncbi:MAG TPA: DNA polymerase/3'-5' exonuclease PolX [Ktedonobacterales bacterium]